MKELNSSEVSQVAGAFFMNTGSQAKLDRNIAAANKNNPSVSVATLQNNVALAKSYFRSNSGYKLNGSNPNYSKIISGENLLVKSGYLLW